MSQSPSILVVDDDDNAANMLSLLLSAGNFERITLAANADEAFELLDLADDAEGAPPRFDVIMLDVMMPETDGIEACARIRATRRYRDVPILMCTGMDETELLNQAFIAGANDYLTKPVRKIEFLARVHSAMRLKRELDRRRAREVELRKARTWNEVDDDRYFDRVTGLPCQEAFNAHVRRAADRDTPHGMLALQVAQAAQYREEAGEAAFQAMIRQVAAAMAEVPAALPWRIFTFGDGLFVVFAPNASPEELARVGEYARIAVDALRLPHGHSAESDHIALVTAAAWGRGTDLLTMPAELIRALDRPAPSPAPAIGPGPGRIAA